MVTAWPWAGGTIRPWTPTGSRSATTIIAVRCLPGLVSRAPRYVGACGGVASSQQREPGPEHLGLEGGLAPASMGVGVACLLPATGRAR